MQTGNNALRNVFRDGGPAEIAAAFADEHPADLAYAMQKTEPGDARAVLRQVAPSQQADVFGYPDRNFQTTLAMVTPRAELAAIVMGMKVDDRVDLYKGLDPATASTPLVTSIADATGVLIYFSIAKSILVMP